MIDEKKLLEKLEELKFANEEKGYDTAKDVVQDCIEIVEKQPQVDKWIPCERELPPQPKPNPLFENKPLELYLVSVKNMEYSFRAFWNGKYFTDGWSKLNVEAWQPLPQPYKKEGAE